MNKDYYTKKEVDDLLSKLKEELIDVLNSKNNIDDPVWFKIHEGLIFHKEYDLIYEGLFENGLIRGPKKMFGRVMSEGLVAQEHGITWIGPKNLCVYLFDKLEDHSVIESSLIEKKIEIIFGIADYSKKKSKYGNNLNKLPRDYEKVDNALSPFFELLSSENVAHQDTIDNPNDYGLMT